MTASDYATIAELQQLLWPIGSTSDTAEDERMTNILTTVSRWIDNETKTRFYTTSSDETRYYTPDDPETLFTDDIISITTLKTDDDADRTYENTWDTNDYDPMPDNAALDAHPYRWIVVAPLGDYRFIPGARKHVQIVGKFGFCTSSDEPAGIKDACLLQASRFYKRKDAPFGVISNPLGGEMRVLSKLDPDVVEMLQPFKRFV